MVLTLVMTTGWTSWDTHKPSTQHHRSVHHSPQPPICQPSTSNFPAPGDDSCVNNKHDNDIISNTRTVQALSISIFSPLFLDERMAHRDQHPRLPVQTAEEAVTDIFQV